MQKYVITFRYRAMWLGQVSISQLTSFCVFQGDPNPESIAEAMKKVQDELNADTDVEHDDISIVFMFRIS